MESKAGNNFIRLVLYMPHDYDLISYFASVRNKHLDNPHVPNTVIVRKALEAYASGERYTLPPVRECVPYQDCPRKIYIRVPLKGVKDAQAIELIQKIEELDENVRNSFVKTLLRSCRTQKQALFSFFREEDLVQDEEEAPVIKQVTPKTKRKETIQKKNEERAKQLVESLNTKEEVLDEDCEIEEEVQDAQDDNDESGASSFDFFGALGVIDM
jgi:hypothetical protein